MCQVCFMKYLNRIPIRGNVVIDRNEYERIMYAEAIDPNNAVNETMRIVIAIWGDHRILVVNPNNSLLTYSNEPRSFVTIAEDTTLSNVYDVLEKTLTYNNRQFKAHAFRVLKNTNDVEELNVELVDVNNRDVIILKPLHEVKRLISEEDNKILHKVITTLNQIINGDE